MAKLGEDRAISGRFFGPSWKKEDCKGGLVEMEKKLHQANEDGNSRVFS